ncbi:MAG: (Fe-S)-binding protein [Deltaproteobacteria bacterium]|jgi:Fe-S oxidoreductase|nr:(Fe-S)-binding protein [Deltaproteobacteria bacterium]MBT4527309.1 (Fe-S)-binding protein [Deltaproteobacteria bacterium]
MNPLLMLSVLLIGMISFGIIIRNKLAILKSLGSTASYGEIGERLKAVFFIAIGQKKLIGRKKERLSGIMHALIFWGFCILFIRSLTLMGEGFQKGFHLPLFNDSNVLGYGYILLKDIAEGVVLCMILFALYRRIIVKPKRMHNSFEAYFVLLAIGFLMITDLFYDGARYNLIQIFGNRENWDFFNNADWGNEFSWTPVAVFFGKGFTGLGEATNTTILHVSFWLHITCLMVLLNFLPLGKHFHVITALPNVFLKTLNNPHVKTQLLDLENEAAWEDESLGLNHIHQLNWKQGLDLYTCTECGRCKDVCPTYLTDKPLNLKDFNDSLKAELFRTAPSLVLRKRLVNQLTQTKDEDAKAELNEKILALNSDKQLVGDIIKPETLWACTTCRACEEVCPVTIEHVPRINAMRQGQTLMAESYPKELNPALKGLERNGNPWGIGYDKRGDWAEGLNIQTLAENAEVEYLFWVGCAGSFDDRAKKVSVAVAKVLQKAGVSFGILGVEEKCTGDFARRAGNEMLFQMMAMENIEVLNSYGVKKIITACPHCLHALKNEYPQLDGNYQVTHSSEIISQLLKQGKIKINSTSEDKITYHDPCYLGRYNQTYQEPREVLQKISQKYTELDRKQNESFCCGAGGARMWMEETIGKRINIERTEEILNSSANIVTVNCPFCMTMIEDGLKEKSKEEDVKVLDLAELVLKSL